MKRKQFILILRNDKQNLNYFRKRNILLLNKLRLPSSNLKFDQRENNRISAEGARVGRNK